MCARPWPRDVPTTSPSSWAELDAANTAAQARGFDYYQLSATRPGDVRFVDVNGDGRVNNDDRTRIGSPHPTNLFGLNLTLGYGGFDFNVFLQAITGSDIYVGKYDRLQGGNHVLNQYTYVLDRWQVPAVGETAAGMPSARNASTTALTGRVDQ